MTQPNEEINDEALDVYSVSSEMIIEQFTIEASIYESRSLQEQLEVVLRQYQVMKHEIYLVITKHIPKLETSLKCNASSLNSRHIFTNVGKATGSAIGLSILLAPETGGLSLLAANIILIAHFADFLIQKKALSYVKDLQDKFKEDCVPAWEAYETLLKQFNKLCDKVDECSTENLGLQGSMQDCIQPKLAHDSSTFGLTLPAGVLSCSNDVAGCNWIPHLKGVEKFIPDKLLSVLQKAKLLADRVAIIAPVVTIVCSGYVLLNTITNFFEPCAASKNIVEYLTKLNDFKKDLQHLDDRMRLGIQCLKSEIARIEERQRSEQQVQRLQQQLEYLITEMTINREAFDHELRAREEQFERHLQFQLTAKQEQFDRQLEIQQKQFDRQLEIQQRAHQEQLESERKEHKEQFNQLHQFMQNQNEMLQKLLANKLHISA